MDPGKPSRSHNDTVRWEQAIQMAEPFSMNCILYSILAFLGQYKLLFSYHIMPKGSKSIGYSCIHHWLWLQLQQLALHPGPNPDLTRWVYLNTFVYMASSSFHHLISVCSSALNYHVCYVTLLYYYNAMNTTPRPNRPAQYTGKKW